MPDIDLDPFEIVATGNLYKRHLVRSAWSERKVILCGQYLYQFTRSDVYRGRFLVANCTVTIIDPDTDIVPPGFFGFILKGLGRDITFCVATKKELISWITVIHDQVRNTVICLQLISILILMKCIDQSSLRTYVKCCWIAKQNLGTSKFCVKKLSSLFMSRLNICHRALYNP